MKKEKFDFYFLGCDKSGTIMKQKVNSVDVMSKGQFHTMKLKGKEEYNRNEMKRRVPIEKDDEEER